MKQRTVLIIGEAHCLLKRDYIRHMPYGTKTILTLEFRGFDNHAIDSIRRLAALRGIRTFGMGVSESLCESTCEAIDALLNMADSLIVLHEKSPLKSQIQYTIGEAEKRAVPVKYLLIPKRPMRALLTQTARCEDSCVSEAT